LATHTHTHSAHIHTLSLGFCPATHCTSILQVGRDVVVTLLGVSTKLLYIGPC